MKGVAAENPRDGLQEGFGKRVFFESQPGIFGAGGVKAAGGWKERRDELLIEADYRLHSQAFILLSVLQASPICSKRVSKGTVLEGDRPIRAYSPVGKPAVWRKDSRRRRLILFLKTALPSFFPTRMLSRWSGESRHRRTKEGQTNFIPGDSISDWI